jgi:hypothetical protein
LYKNVDAYFNTQYPKIWYNISYKGGIESGRIRYFFGTNILLNKGDKIQFWN